MPLDGTTWRVWTPAEIDVLREVRENIAKPGAWCQRSIQRQDGARCVMGHVIDAARHHRFMAPRLIDKLGGWIGLIMVNDVECKTQADVVAFLDRVIGDA